MARNEEKAQSMLYRFREAQAIELGHAVRKDEKRPYLASLVASVSECERWRGQVIREISRNMSKIMDATLSEYQIRDLNDLINKLIREKGHWEYRIRDLGGPDHRRAGTRVLGEDGKEVPGGKGYKYFGRAKELPGVKELFAVDQTTKKAEEERISRSELYKRVDADYYGYRDEDDGVLLASEVKHETMELEKLYSQLRTFKANSSSISSNTTATTNSHLLGIQSLLATASSSLAATSTSISDDAFLVQHFPVPSQKEVEAWLVQRRKQALMDRFA